MLNKGQRIVPLYYQVEHIIRQRIVNGIYAPASQIPSENELSREMGVSRVTVREALRGLVRERILIKVQGKGTFVTDQPLSNLIEMKFTGYLEDLYDRVRLVSVKDVEISKIAAGNEISELLRLGLPETEIVRIKRLRFVSNAPYSYTINFLPLDIGSRVEKEDLYRIPLLWILQEKLKVPITRAHETIEAVAAEPEVSERLGVPVLSPVMHVKRVMYTEQDQPMELVESYYRADRYQYSINLIRVKSDKGKWTWNLEP